MRALADELAVRFGLLDTNMEGRIDIADLFEGIKLVRGAADAKRQVICIADAGRLSRLRSALKRELDGIDCLRIASRTCRIPSARPAHLCRHSKS